MSWLHALQKFPPPKQRLTPAVTPPGHPVHPVHPPPATIKSWHLSLWKRGRTMNPKSPSCQSHWSLWGMRWSNPKFLKDSVWNDFMKHGVTLKVWQKDSENTFNLGIKVMMILDPSDLLVWHTKKNLVNGLKDQEAKFKMNQNVSRVSYNDTKSPWFSQSVWRALLENKRECEMCWKLFSHKKTFLHQKDITKNSSYNDNVLYRKTKMSLIFTVSVTPNRHDQK